MSKSKKVGIDSIGYTEAHMEVLKKSKASDSVQISGFTASIKRANAAKLVADIDSGEKPLKECGKDD